VRQDRSGRTIGLLSGPDLLVDGGSYNRCSAAPAHRLNCGKLRRIVASEGEERMLL
jgi:hypothetical protein